MSAAASAEEKSKAQREAYNASSSGPSTSGTDATAGDAPVLIMHGSRICFQKHRTGMVKDVSTTCSSSQMVPRILTELRGGFGRARTSHRWFVMHDMPIMLCLP